MKSIGFTVTTVLVVLILLGGGYAALATLRDPAAYVPDKQETVGDLHRIVTEPQTSSSAQVPASTPVAQTPAATPTTPSSSTAAATDMQGILQSLLDTKTVLKKGSRGPAVGAVQEFLNAYLKKTTKIDNDFGPTLETNLKAFQKAQGISQTGQTGPQTVQAMLDWLKKNPQ